MELFKTKAGIDVVHVPYKGTAQAVQDLLGGQVGVMFLPVHVALPQADARQARDARGRRRRARERHAERAVARAKPPACATSTPTSGTACMRRRARRKRSIDRLNADVNRVLKLPDVVDTLAKQGLQATGGTPAALAELTKSDLERWTRGRARGEDPARLADVGARARRARAAPRRRARGASRP